MQGGWTPPSHNAVLDDHLTKLYDTAKSQLQSYAAALAERKRKVALLSDGKKMKTDTHVLTLCSQTMRAPCFARTSTHLDTARPLSGMLLRSKRSSRKPGEAFRSFSLTPLESAHVKCRRDLAACMEHNTHCRRMRHAHTAPRPRPPPLVAAAHTEAARVQCHAATGSLAQ